MNNHKVKCSNFEIANNKPFTLIAGPCQLENEEHALKISTELKNITSDLGINLIYKTSFDKANRTSLKGKRGLGLQKSLPIFDKINSSSDKLLGKLERKEMYKQISEKYQKTINSVPQIELDDEYVGGWIELKQILKMVWKK